MIQSDARCAAGEPLACVRPGGRGHFGDAVLTRAAVARADSHDFQAQAGTERRRWLCVTTRAAQVIPATHTDHAILLVGVSGR